MLLLVTIGLLLVCVAQLNIVLCAITCLFGIGLFFYVGVYRSIKTLNQDFQRFNLGYDSHALFLREEYYTKTMLQTFRKIGLILENQQVIKLTNRQAQYLALQNQINPHFLYNTLEAIRSDALAEGLDTVATTTEALATFFRYTISNVDKLVTLEEELCNAENYFAIQNYRFGDKIGMTIINDEKEQNLLNCLIPKLTLQPIIENAIIHGIENKIGKGLLRIQIETDGMRLLVSIIDDGIGMSEETLSHLNQKLLHLEGRINEKSSEGGIALVNVNNRIKLLFGEVYGLSVSSIEYFGTRVDVTLPLQWDENR